MPLLDTICIVVCALLLVLSLMSVLSDTFVRKIKLSTSKADSEQKAVSVVLVSYNNAEELSNNLDVFLSQDYPAGYEVIVAVIKDEDGTKDVLKFFSGHKNLRFTFVPDTYRYVSRHKLAVTLGVKASENEHVLITDAKCSPVSDKWISNMMSSCGDDTDMVLGVTTYDENTKPLRRFIQTHKQYSLLREASVGAPYALWGNNLMIRKSLFMRNAGFQDNLKYIRGEYDFIVNSYSVDAKVAVNVSREGCLVEAEPSRKEWQNKNMYYMETRRHLSGSFSHRAKFNLDMLSLYLSLLLSIAAIVFEVLLQQWLYIPVAVISFVVPIVFRIRSAQGAMSAMSSKVPSWKIVPFELLVMLVNLVYMVRYKMSDKIEFISHKI